MVPGGADANGLSLRMYRVLASLKQLAGDESRPEGHLTWIDDSSKLLREPANDLHREELPNQPTRQLVRKGTAQERFETRPGRFE
jgi:hypothetical protein